MSLRLVIIGILILILLIPLGMIQELIRERMYFQKHWRSTLP